MDNNINFFMHIFCYREYTHHPPMYGPMRITKDIRELDNQSCSFLTHLNNTCAYYNPIIYASRSSRKESKVAAYTESAKQLSIAKL